MTMKKHFICTHTWNNDEARQEALAFMEKMTDKDFLDLLNNDKAETVQHWMGKDDFFSVTGTRKVRKLFTKPSRQLGLPLL